jgi:hypothetical protein
LNPLGEYEGKEFKHLNVPLDKELKKHFSRGMSDVDAPQRAVFAAMIEDYLIEDENGYIQLDVDDLNIEKWREIYA